VAHYILVIDDDNELREALCDALEVEGYQVVCVEHGAAALDHLQSTQQPPCVILLDLMMPVMDGRAFREALLERPELAGIPVVLITAAGPKAAASVSATTILHKPLRINNVIDVVREHCPDSAQA